VRGAEADRCDELRQSLTALSGLARHCVDVRPFTVDVDQITRSLTRAALCVMPSRVEGFGLAALEAIGVGTPVLVTARSGLAETLRRHLGPVAEPMIVDVTDNIADDTHRWRDAMQRVLDDLPAAFAYTRWVRGQLAEVMTWDGTVRRLAVEVLAPASAVNH
jgi:glycosyltransferase involved in cell wall biosynthesis